MTDRPSVWTPERYMQDLEESQQLRAARRAERKARDPKLDPVPGDVFYKDGTTRTVNYIDPPDGRRPAERRMTVRSTWPQKTPKGRRLHMGRNAYPTLAAFRRWAKNATVKTRA